MFRSEFRSPIESVVMNEFESSKDDLFFFREGRSVLSAQYLLNISSLVFHILSKDSFERSLVTSEVTVSITGRASLNPTSLDSFLDLTSAFVY